MARDRLAAMRVSPLFDEMSSCLIYMVPYRLLGSRAGIVTVGLINRALELIPYFHGRLQPFFPGR